MAPAKSYFLALLALSTLISQCAHYPDVVPGANGLHSVVTHQDDETNARRDAISQASDYCGKNDKKPAMVEEKTVYEGTMKEEDYKAYKMGATAAGALGGAAAVFGGRNESQAGTAVAVGGGVGHTMLGKPYSTKMKFKCN